MAATPARRPDRRTRRSGIDGGGAAPGPAGYDGAAPNARDPLILLAATADPVKLSALQAALAAAQVRCEVFDAAAGSMWGSAIPSRLMVADADLARARSALAAAGFRPAADGDWDLRTG